MRGEPNSLTCQFASNPSGVTDEDSGNVLPMKLGDGHADRNVAARSLPPCRKQSEAVPRRLTTVLKATRAPVAVGANGAAANNIPLPRPGFSLRTASRPGCPFASTPADLV